MATIKDLFYGNQEMIIAILNFMEEVEIDLFMRRVCKLFAQVAENTPTLYKKLYFYGYKRKRYLLVTTHPSFKKYLTDLSLLSCDYLISPLCAMFCQQLEDLEFTATLATLEQVSKFSFGALCSVSFSGDFGGDADQAKALCSSVAKFVGQCDKLKHVKLDERSYRSTDNHVPALVEMLSQIVPKLQTLKMNNFKLSGAAWKQIIEECPDFGSKLVTLDVTCTEDVNKFCDALVHCSNLTSLDVRPDYRFKMKMEHVKQFAMAVASLSQLKELRFSMSMPTVQDENTFYEQLPTSLRELRLSNVELLQFPNIKHLVNLKVINFYATPCATLPVWIHELPALKDICMRAYELEKLPHFTLASTLPRKLIELSLIKYQGSLQGKFFENTRIAQLSIEDSSLEGLNDELLSTLAPTLYSLRLKNVSNFTLSKDVNLAKLKNLYALSLENIAIDHDINLCGMKDMFSLMLNKCNLKQFPSELLNMKSLLVLHLDNNQLVTIPAITCDAFPSLEYLFLNNNLLESVPDFSQNRMLRLVGLRNNPMVKNVELSEPMKEYYDKLSKAIMNHILLASNPNFLSDKIPDQTVPQECIIDFILPLHNMFQIAYWINSNHIYNGKDSYEMKRYQLAMVRKLSQSLDDFAVIEIHTDHEASENEYPSKDFVWDNEKSHKDVSILKRGKQAKTYQYGPAITLAVFGNKALQSSTKWSIKIEHLVPNGKLVIGVVKKGTVTASTDYPDRLCYGISKEGTQYFGKEEEDPQVIDNFATWHADTLVAVELITKQNCISIDGHYISLDADTSAEYVPIVLMTPGMTVSLS